MVSDPVLGSSTKFSLISNETKLFPVPLLSELITIQGSLPVTVQSQAGPVVTLTEPSPPLAVMGRIDDDNENEHGTGLNLK
jgi:hypothetical protein